MPISRVIYCVGFLLAAFSVAVTYYVELIDNIAPCPLCLLQRFFMCGMLLVFLVAIFHNTKKAGNRIYGLLAVLFSAAGAAIAIRQLMLQHLPAGETPPACGVSLGYLLQTFPLPQAVKIVFQGSAECATISWAFLNLSMASWALIFFTLFCVMGLIQLFHSEKS